MRVKDKMIGVREVRMSPALKDPSVNIFCMQLCVVADVTIMGHYYEHTVIQI